jgi:hypothetical protein
MTRADLMPLLNMRVGHIIWPRLLFFALLGASGGDGPNTRQWVLSHVVWTLWELSGHGPLHLGCGRVPEGHGRP